MTEHAQPDSTPRYLRHTFSSKSSGSSQHAEIERVANSFRSSNFLSLHALPASLRPGGIEESRRTRISSGRSSKPEHIHRVKTNKEYFSPITYSRDEYMKVAADDKMEQQHKQLTSLSFSRKPFTYATSRIRLKNEDIFGDEKYKFPVLGPGAKVTELETVVRTDFTDATKMLHGPFFVPARVQQEYPRDELELWGKEVFSCLQEDWAHLRFSLHCVGDDELVVSFCLDKNRSINKQADDESHVEDHTDPMREEVPEIPICESENNGPSHSNLIETLGRYMNTMALHGAANHRRLRKRGDRWKVIEFTRDKDSDSDKRLLVFSFYTPWYNSATRNIQKRVSTEERKATRRIEMQLQASNRAKNNHFTQLNEAKSRPMNCARPRMSGIHFGARNYSGTLPVPFTSTTSSNSPRSE